MKVVPKVRTDGALGTIYAIEEQSLKKPSTSVFFTGKIYAIMVSTTKGKGGIPLRTRTILAAAALLLAAGLAAVAHQAVSQALTMTDLYIIHHRK